MIYYHLVGLICNNVMNDGGISNSREFTEEIEVGYYSNATIHLQDINENIKAAMVLNAKPGIYQND